MGNRLINGFGSCQNNFAGGRGQKDRCTNSARGGGSHRPREDLWLVICVGLIMGCKLLDCHWQLDVHRPHLKGMAAGVRRQTGTGAEYWHKRKRFYIRTRDAVGCFTEGTNGNP